MAAKKHIHIVPNPEGGWDVKNEKKPTPVAHTPKKEDAVTIGREHARQEQCDVIIHKRDGTIEKRDSYGSDPYPPKG